MADIMLRDLRISLRQGSDIVVVVAESYVDEIQVWC